MSELTRRVPVVTLVGPSAADVAVFGDGTLLANGKLRVPLPLDPGKHVFEVRSPGRADVHVEVTLREGQKQTIELAVGDALSSTAKPAPRASGPSVTAAPTDGRTQRVAGALAAGAGLASVAVGAVYGLVSKGTYDNALTHCAGGLSSCSPEGVSGVDRAHSQALVSTVAFAVGGVFLAGGAALYLTAPKAPSMGLAPAVSPRSAGLSARVEW
jgi:hypothetical protein